MNELRAQSVKEYLQSVNNLFIAHDFAPPINFELKKAPPALFYENVKIWQNKPNRRTHLTPEFLSELLLRAKKDKASTGLVAAMADFTILGRYTGIRLSEYGQSTQQTAAHHTMPSGRKILKAFRRGDFVFKDKAGQTIADPITNIDLVESIVITWRVQKNCRNGQKIAWNRDRLHPDLCPILAALRIYSRSLRLGLTDDQPMGAYLERGKVRYLTGSKISALFKDIAKFIYPNITKKDLSQFSAHMIRVSAAVLLQVADKPEHFIKMRLRWESDTYRLYLRNTSIIAMKHLEANVAATLLESAYKLQDIGVTTPNVPAQVSIVEMGPYLVEGESNCI